MRVSAFAEPLVFVDIETNGLNHVRGRVIEVGAIRVENGKVVRHFKSLVDPEAELPQYISRLTGITSGDLVGAPTFRQIADELNEVMTGAIFVAHNVRFDYSFLKQEFSRLNQSFLPKQLCTVKLSRALYPEERSHKLESLIRRHSFQVAARHRAYDDAHVLWQFVQHIQKHFTPEQIDAAIGRQLTRPALPKGVPLQLVNDLPETPGVYIFEDSYGQPLYVGKSVNIKKRVLSHFGRDHAESKEFKIAQTIHNIRTHQTADELSALLLESRLVKELQPVHNRRLRRLKKLVLAKQLPNEHGFMEVSLEEVDSIDLQTLPDILAVYPNRSKAKQSLENLLRLHDLCPKLLGLEKTRGVCFWHQLKKCRGACAAKEDPETYNQRLQIAFERQRIQAWPYKGPVMVSSKDNRTHGIIIDQWCVLGEVTQEEFCDPVVQTTIKRFDLDTYKILQSHLIAKIGQLKIQVLGREQLQSLLQG